MGGHRQPGDPLGGRAPGALRAPDAADAELLEQTRSHTFTLRDSLTLTMPVGWYLWIITIEHEAVEHVDEVGGAYSGSMTSAPSPSFGLSPRWAILPTDDEIHDRSTNVALHMLERDRPHIRKPSTTKESRS